MSIVLAPLLGLLAVPQTLERFEFTQRQMGVSFVLILYAPNETTANDAAAEVFTRIRQLNASLSDYEPESEINLLVQKGEVGHPFPISPDLSHALLKSREVWLDSGGKFDVTVGPLVQLWRRSRKEKILPSPEEVARARRAVGLEALEIDQLQGTVTLRKSNIKLDFGGIAIGIAVDSAAEILKRRGIDRFLIDASGDIRAGEPPPDQQGWKVALDPLEPEAEPNEFILLKNQAITTSGDAFQFVEIEGVRYSHIVDPATGLGLTSKSSAAVVAPDCTRADAWATALCVLGPQVGPKILSTHPDLSMRMIFVESGTGLPNQGGTKIRVLTTEGFPIVIN